MNLCAQKGEFQGWSTDSSASHFLIFQWRHIDIFPFKATLIKFHHLTSNLMKNVIWRTETFCTKWTIQSIYTIWRVPDFQEKKKQNYDSTLQNLSTTFVQLAEKVFSRSHVQQYTRESHMLLTVHDLLSRDQDIPWLGGIRLSIQLSLPRHDVNFEPSVETTSSCKGFLPLLLVFHSVQTDRFFRAGKET